MTAVASEGYLSRPRVRLLNAEVDNVTMDELVESFDEGMMLRVQVRFRADHAAALRVAHMTSQRPDFR